MTDIRFLKISINGLKTRTTPAGDSANTNLRHGEIIEVDYDQHVERNGLIWVQHHEGWSAIRPITLGVGQRAYVEDITHEVPASGVMFRVRYASLNVRKTPNGTPNEYIVMNKDVIIGEKLRQGQPNNGGHVWWQHKLGWTSERHGNTIYMNKIRDVSNPLSDLTLPPIALINPASVTTITKPPTIISGNGDDDPQITDKKETFYFRVTDEEGVNIRKSHDAKSEQDGFADFEEVIATQTKIPKVSGNYRWLNLTNDNWGALGRKNSTVDWLQLIEKPQKFEPSNITRTNIHELPLWRELFTDLPVEIPPEDDWFQYFGNTVFAFTKGHEYNYDGYSQGLHGGIDFGSSRKSLDIFARTTGEVVKVIDKSGSRNQVHVQSGSYLVIYLHLENHSHYDLKERDDLPFVGQAVTPNSFIGKTLFGSGQPNHLHFEVRYKENMIVNPLELLPEAASNVIIALYNPNESSNGISHLCRFYQNSSWSQWYTPFDQPVIERHGDLVGPKSKL